MRCDNVFEWVGEQVLKEYRNLRHNRGLQGHGGRDFLSVYVFSIDPQNVFDGSISGPGYSVICKNPGLFKFWGKSVDY